MEPVDVVVVSYNSSGTLRRCVEGLAPRDGVTVFVVDNMSSDGTLASIDDLPVVQLPQQRNGGFAFGCNAGWRVGSSPYVLLLNPDAVIDTASLEALVDVLDRNPSTGMAVPRIVNDDGTLEYSQRRFPRLVSTFSQAFFAHRLFPQASWTDELVRDAEAYETETSPPWASGACMLLRRSVLVDLDGLDEGFFLYGEDVDLCRRVRQAGWDIRYDPRATCGHVGGASAPRPGLLPVLAASRIRYAQKHRSRAVALLERAGVALSALTHVIAARGGLPVRTGHARSLVVALTPTGFQPSSRSSATGARRD